MKKMEMMVQDSFGAIQQKNDNIKLEDLSKVSESNDFEPLNSIDLKDANSKERISNQIRESKDAVERKDINEVAGLYDSFGFEKQSQDQQIDTNASKVQQFNLNNILNDNFGLQGEQNSNADKAKNTSFDQNSLTNVSAQKTPIQANQVKLMGSFGSIPDQSMNPG